jgi:phage terminase large subunit-like protein
MDLTKIVVGVDPSVTSGDDADETGIIVAGRGPHQPSRCLNPYCDAHAYVLQDASMPAAKKNSVDKWAKRVIDAFDEWNASLVVIEGNMGQELLDSVLRTIRPGLPVKRPNAKETKKARAEPVVALYEQGRVHHVGDPLHFAKLEDQMTSWVPPPEGKRATKSPDRVDALVYAISELNIQGKPPRLTAGTDDDPWTPTNFDQVNPWAF